MANYAIVFEGQEESSPSGPWEHSVRTAVDSTRAAFPGGHVFAHLDRKSFKGGKDRHYPPPFGTRRPSQEGKGHSPPVIVKSLV